MSKNYHILFVCNEPGPVQSIIDHFKENGWKANCTYSIKNAQQYILNQDVSHVLISLDHTNNALNKLTNILNTKLNIATVIFTEGQDQKAIENFNKFSHPNKIPLPLDGDHFFSSVKKIEARDPKDERDGNQKAHPTLSSSLNIEKSKNFSNSLQLEESSDKNTTSIKNSLKNSFSSIGESTEVSQEHFANTEFVYAVPVQSYGQLGCILIAFEKNSNLEHELLSETLAKIDAASDTKYVNLFISQARQIHIPVTNFLKWADQNAEIKYSTIIDKKEALLTFISNLQSTEIVQDSAVPNMAAISVENIYPETTLDFNLFLYLKKNEHFLNYIRKGGFLMIKQLENLIQKKQSEFHINRKDLNLFYTYRMEHDIVNLMKDYNENNKKKAS